MVVPQISEATLDAAVHNLNDIVTGMDEALKSLRSDFGYGLVDSRVAQHLITTQTAVRLLARTLEMVLKEIAR